METSTFSLNPEQKEAVSHTGGPSLVAAGPGSGKTRILTHKIAHLIKEMEVSPQKILAVTFTNKAAQEMRERVAALIGQDVGGMWIGTFHATCAKTLRIDGEEVGIPKSFVIYDENDRKSLIKKIIKASGLEGRFSPHSIQSAISNAKNELIGHEEYEQLAGGYFQEIVAEIFVKYQQKLKEADALDFDDLLFKAVRLLKNQPQILEKWQKRFLHILVDEYQDTNRAQYELVQLLSQKHQNLTVVGDMSQAIYSWRGADFRNILRFEKDYPKAKIFRLSQNYRSTKTILSAAKSLIEHNKTHIPLDLWTQNGNGLPIVVSEVQSELDEAYYITSQIRSMRSGGGIAKFSDFAVLYRTNAQSRVLEEVFMREGIPYVLIGGFKFYERKEVKDLLAYLKLLLNSKDTVSFQRAKKIGKRRLKNFLEIAGPETLNEPPVVILDKILKATKYIEYLNDGTEQGQSRIENAKELRSVAAPFSTLGEFLEHVALVQPTDALPTKGSKKRGNCVNLMTLHSAKGLEFSTVFMAGLEEGILPHSRSMGSLEEMEEERRLCYVGMTRAKRHLHLCFAKDRMFFGTRSFSAPSRFLTEIGSRDVVFHLPQESFGQ